MRPRMYGSSERKAFFTSTSPSRGRGTGTLSMRKLSSRTQPSGRLARSTRLFSIGTTSLTGTAPAGEQARRPLHHQHLAAALGLEAAVDRHQGRRHALVPAHLGELLLQALARARVAERPGEPGAALAEQRAVVGADDAERPAQGLDPSLALQVAALRAFERVEHVVRLHGVAPRRVAPALEQQAVGTLAPAAEVVELGAADALAHQVGAVGTQRERDAEA